MQTEIKFDLNQADRYKRIIGSKITRNPIRFWREVYNDGVSGFGAALIQDNRIRKLITEFVKKSDKLGTLKLISGVISETRWAHNYTKQNVVTMPDIVTKLNKKASDFVQIKILKDIGEHKGQIPTKLYLLDYFKSLGSYDPLIGITNNLQFEFIPKSSNLTRLIEMDKKENIVIISYWSNHVPEIGRIAEVIASIRLAKYVNGISDREKIVDYIFKQLSRGQGALGYKRSNDKDTERVIQELIGLTSTDSEVFFLRDSFLMLLQQYGVVLLAYPS